MTSDPAILHLYEQLATATRQTQVALEERRAALRNACDDLQIGLARLEHALTDIAGNDERRLAIAAQCGRLRRVSAWLSTPDGQRPEALCHANQVLVLTARAIALFTTPVPETGARDADDPRLSSGDGSADGALPSQ